MTSAPSGGCDDRPSFPCPDTRPIPLPRGSDGADGACGPAGPRGRAAAVGARLLAAVRTPRGAGAVAAVAGTAVVLVVGLATSPPTGAMDLGGVPLHDEVQDGHDVAGLVVARDQAVHEAAAAADAPPGDRVPRTVNAAADDVVVRLFPTGADRASYHVPAEVTAVRAAVTGAPTGCSVDAVRTWTPAGPLTLRLAAGVPVSVGLRAGAPPACRSGRVVVSGTVTATGQEGHRDEVAVSGTAVLPAVTAGHAASGPAGPKPRTDRNGVSPPSRSVPSPSPRQ